MSDRSKRALGLRSPASAAELLQISVVVTVAALTAFILLADAKDWIQFLTFVVVVTCGRALVVLIRRSSPT